MKSAVSHLLQTLTTALPTLVGVMVFVQTYTLAKILVESSGRLQELGPRLSHFVGIGNQHPTLTFLSGWLVAILVFVGLVWFGLRLSRARKARAA